MKNSLADELSNILLSLRRQNTDISKTLSYLKKNKSMDTIHLKTKADVTNPEIR